MYRDTARARGAHGSSAVRPSTEPCYNCASSCGYIRYVLPISTHPRESPLSASVAAIAAHRCSPLTHVARVSGHTSSTKNRPVGAQATGKAEETEALNCASPHSTPLQTSPASLASRATWLRGTQDALYNKRLICVRGRCGPVPVPVVGTARTQGLSSLRSRETTTQIKHII